MRHKPFRNPQGDPVSPIRELLGSMLPSGRQGFVVEDIDGLVVAADGEQLILRRYGPNFGLDDIGDFMLAEFKYRSRLDAHCTDLDTAQRRTFELMHEQCELGDLWRVEHGEPGRYCGFYVIAYNKKSPDTTSTLWRVRRLYGEIGDVWTWSQLSQWITLSVANVGA